MLSTKISYVSFLFLFISEVLLAAPAPSAIAPADQDVFIGENVSIQVAFDNTDLTATGYGPFLDVVLPVNGADGVAGSGTDGIDLVGGASYLGVSVNTIEQTFPNDGGGTGCVDHEFAVDNTGTALQVCGAAGDKLVTIELPFGSFVPDQPAAVIDLNLSLSNLADLGTGLVLSSRAGFRFGADALDNFATDPSILSDSGTNHTSWAGQTTITPTLITLTKAYSGPEDETATGPNFPRQYTITVDVAPGQVVTDLDVTDFLPDNMAFLSLISSNSSSGAGSATSTPTVGVPQNPTANELTVNFATITGGTPVTVIFEYFIPRLDAGSAVIIDAASGDDVISQNQAKAIGDWDPLDGRDAGATDNAVADPVGIEHTLTDKSIAIQKSVAISNDVGAIGEENPGDTLAYTLTFQVSDYFSFDDVVITDIISDGQRFDPAFTPTITINIHGATPASGNMSVFNSTPGADVINHYSSPADHDPTDGTDGTTDIIFRVGDELTARVADSRMSGGCVPDAGTGSGNPADCTVSDQGATTATIVFHTIIQQNFSDEHGVSGGNSGDQSVDQGDVLTNDVTVAGQLLSVEDNSTTTGNHEEDTSAASVSIAYGNLSKEIYKVNGNDPVGNPIPVQPGDTITYRLRYSMPTSDVEDLVFIDYLPKPVLLSTEILVFDDTNAGIPAAGHAQYGPNDTFGASHGGVFPGSPVIAKNAQENSLTFTFGHYDNTDQAAREVDLLFTVTVNNEPFADGLFLTNQVRVTQGSTNAGNAQADAIIQIKLEEPVLEITKGVSATSNAGSTINPSPAILPIDGDLTNADAGDQVTFVITVENQGHAPAYDVLVTDTRPAELENCLLSSVTDGSRDPLANDGGDLFSAGLTITSLAVNDGSIGAPYTTDTALITLICDVVATINPAVSFNNEATVEWKAEVGAGTPFTSKSDTAMITITTPSVAKLLTSFLPGGASPNITVADTLTYTITVTVPEGVTPALTLTDTLPAGLLYQSGTIVVTPGSFAGTLDTSPIVTVAGQDISIEFGDVTATGSTGTVNNTFTLTLQAKVDDHANNAALNSLQNKTNSVDLDYTGGSTLTATASTNFAEPELQISKTMSPADIDAGDTITVTFLVQNTGTSPAYNIEVTDVLNDTDILFDLTTIAAGSTPAGFTYSYSNPIVTYTSNAGVSLPAGASVSFTFTGTAHADIISGSSYDNEANVIGDGQNGGVTGERSSSHNDTGTVLIAKSAVVKQLFESSEDWTSGSDAAIGEVLTFQLTFDIPEGQIAEDTITPKAIITDQLPAGFQFIVGTAQIRTENAASPLNGSKYLGGNLPGSDTLIVPGVTLSPELLSFDLGTITNSDNDADIEKIIISYDVLVLNNANNNRSDDKTNTASGNYLNVDNQPQSVTDTHTATIVEPRLAVNKTALPATVQGGDTVTFTVTISNPSAANVTRAWDVVLSDVLPARYDANYILTNATLSRGSVDITACAAFGGAGGNELNFDMSCRAAADRYLDPDDTIELIYKADVDVSIAYEEDVTNTVDIQGSSIPGLRGTLDATPGNSGAGDGERTGDGSGSNDISATDSATITAGVPTISKSGTASLAIGDVTTMTLDVDVPVGTTSGFVITDNLPAGLRFNGTATIDPANDTATFTATNNPLAIPAAGTDPLIFNFGDITNTGAAAQRITITYEVEVENIIGNQRGDNLTNTASLTYTGASASPSDTAIVTVLEPDIEITKTITAGNVGSDAGDAISYQLLISNNGNSTAFAMDLRDVLPAGMLGAADGTGSTGIFFQNIVIDNDSNSVVLTAGGSPLNASDHQFLTTTNTADTLSWSAFDLPVGRTLTITYDAVIHNNIVAGTVLTNTVTSSYTSLTAGQGRSNADSGDDDVNTDLNNYGESDTASFTVANIIGIQKNLNVSHSANDFTIGDLVTFDLRIDMTEGITHNVSVIDTLPAGLSQVGAARIIALGHFSYNGTPDLNTLTWDMGAVTNTSDGDNSNDFFIIEVDAHVDDVPANVDGFTLTNSASVTSDSGNAGPDTTDIDIIEPKLIVTKTASDTTPSLGDKITYSIVVTHDTSTADAHDVIVTDLIPAGLIYVAGSHSGAGSVDENNLAQPIFNLGTITLADNNKSFTFDVIVDVSATVGLPITNQVDVDYDGQANTPTVERSYSDSGTEDVTPHIDALIDALKTVNLVIDSGNPGVVDPGDTLEYSITLVNNGNSVTGVNFIDRVPTHTTYVTNTLATDTGTADDSSDPQLVVVVGNMATNDTVQITFRVIVNAGTSSGTIISNQGSVDSDQTVPEPTDQDGIDSNGDQPTDIPVGGSGATNADLYTVKLVNWKTDVDSSSDITAGDTMTYQLFMINQGNVPLTGVTLGDTIPAGLTYVGATATISGSGNNVSVIGTNVSATIPALAVGDLILIEFDVTIDAFAALTQTFVNQADTNSDQTPADQSDGNAFPDDGNQPTRFTAVNGTPGVAALDLEKRVALIVDNDSDGLTDPNDTLLYTMTLSNTGSADAINVRLQDAIPANTTIVTGTVSTSQGIVVSEDPININMGVLPASALAVVQFYVTIDSATVNGTIISNQATATADGLSDEPSDDNGLDSDGKNPNLTPVHTHIPGGPPPGIPALNKTLINSSEADSPLQNALIGEVLTYRIDGIMPEGVLKNVLIQDTLPAGLSYIAGSGRLSRSFDTGLLSADNPGNINAAASGLTVILTDGVDIHDNANVISLVLGSVTNSDNDAGDETYRLEFQVLVENIGTNQAGISLTNSAVLSYLDGLGQSQSLASQGVSVTLLEPNLLVQKTADSTTILPEGGVINYTIVVTNPAQGNTVLAYNVVIDDILPAEFTSLTVNSITPTVGISGIQDNTSGTTLSIDVDTFPVDATLTLSLTGTAPAPLTRGAVLTNTAQITGTSLPGTNGTGSVTPGAAGSASGERTGSGSVNDYYGSDAVAVTVIPVIDLELNKAVNNTIPDTGSIVTFTLSVENNGPSEATNIVITDILANGYTYENGTMTGGSSQNQSDPQGAGLSWTINSLAAGADSVLTFDALVLETGDYTNSAQVSAATETDSDSTPDNDVPSEDDQDSVNNVIPRSLNFSVAPACINDAAWLNYTITANGFTPQNGATIEWIDANGIVRETLSNQPLAGQLLWYGMAIDAQGKPTQWTGWDFVAGDWVKKPDFGLLRPDMTVRVTVNPSRNAVVTYPHATRICSSNPVGSIGNYVWYDTDQDGVQDAEENGIAGVVVNLYDAGNNLVSSTQTDGNGYYQFPKMLSNDYQVEIVKPSGYSFVSADQGSGPLQDSFDSDADELTGRSPIFTLNALDNNQTLDAGLVLDSGAPASIGDRVWYDSNANGIQDPGEPGVAGVTIQLYDASMTLIASDITDGSGAYIFNGLIPDDYYVVFAADASYEFSPMKQGVDDTGDSDADAISGRTALIHLTANQHHANVDAGISIPLTLPASIGDYVWNDTNADGNQDAGEPGLGNIQVRLYNALDLTTIVSMTTTSSAGQYLFSGLPAGDYVIGFVAPGGLTFSPAGTGIPVTDSNADQQTGLTAVTVLAAGDVVTDVDAGLFDSLSVITIGDLVWLDNNRNNQSDPGEGLSGVTVVLFDSLGNKLMSTVTDSDGLYSFINVNSGNYRVEVDTTTLPANTVQISDPDENDICTDCDSASDLISLNNNIDTVDFGYKRTIVQPIPTLSEWMLIILCGLLLLIARVRLDGEKKLNIK